MKPKPRLVLPFCVMIGATAYLSVGADAPRSRVVPIDLRTQTVGNVLPTDSLGTIRAKVGEANVKGFAYEDEGDTYQAYEVRFKHGRAAKLYLSHFEITSIDFRTREGLGIGSTWKEFKKAYADGQLFWASDAKAVWSERFKFRLYFEGDHEPVLQDHVTRIDVNRSVVRW